MYGEILRKIKVLGDDNFRFLFSRREFKINPFAFLAFPSSFQIMLLPNPLLYNFFLFQSP